MESKTLEFAGVEVTININPYDKVPVIEIDTPDLEDGEEGPKCRVWLNDFLMHEGVKITPITERK